MRRNVYTNALEAHSESHGCTLFPTCVMADGPDIVMPISVFKLGINLAGRSARYPMWA